MQATDILDESEKFDAIVVDEGQDFNELWWASLQGMFKDPNNMEAYYVFFDPNQNIFNLEPTIPPDFPFYSLEDN